MAKLQGQSRSRVAAASEAVQIHGGLGYMLDTPVARFYCDAKVLEIGEGTNEIQHMVIAADRWLQPPFAVRHGVPSVRLTPKQSDGGESADGRSDVVAIGEPGVFEVGRVRRGGGGGADPLDRRVEVPEALAPDGAAISAPMPNGTTASWAMRSRLVFATDSRIGAMSSGATVRRSITSTEMPSPASCPPRPRPHSCTIRETETTVTSVPARTTADVPIGTMWSARRLGPLHAVEQAVLDEDHRVGVLDGGAEQTVGVGRRRRHDDGEAGDVGQQRLEALRVLAPRRAAGAELRPDGRAPSRAAPPVMNGIFAAWFISWSRHTPTKSRYISSTTGRIPAIAAPTPSPMIAVSEIGVSRTRGPKRSWRPLVRPKTLPPSPTSIPATNTRSSAPSSNSRASWTASIVRKTGASAAGGGGSGCVGPRRGRRSRTARTGAGRPDARAVSMSASRLPADRLLERGDARARRCRRRAGGAGARPADRAPSTPRARPVVR